MSKARRELRSIETLSKAEVYEGWVNEPLAWVSQAVGLLRSAFVLWVEFARKHTQMMNLCSNSVSLTPELRVDVVSQTFGQNYMLLAGLGIENLLKGLIVAKGQRQSRPGALPLNLKTHDLKALCGAVGIRLDESDMRLVELLTEMVTWRGRYVVPLVALSHWMKYSLLIKPPDRVKRFFDLVMAEFPPPYWDDSTVSDDPTSPSLVHWSECLQKECPSSELA